MSAGPLLFVGQTVLDQVMRVASLRAGDGRFDADELDSRVGGMAAHAARAAQRLRDRDRSPRVRLVSAVGDDAAGLQVRHALVAEGLDIERVNGTRTSVSAVLVDPRGGRQVHNFRGDALQHAPLRALPDACAGVLVDPRWPQAATAALEHADVLGVPSVLDAEAAPEDVLRALAARATWCVFSLRGLAAFRGQAAGAASTALAEVAQVAPRAELVVSLGAEGALWRRPDGREQHLPAFPVAVRDTNGAGDVLHGALLLSLAEGMAPEAALRRAMAAAALACRGALPTRAELDEFLALQ